MSTYNLRLLGRLGGIRRLAHETTLFGPRSSIARLFDLPTHSFWCLEKRVDAQAAACTTSAREFDVDAEDKRSPLHLVKVCSFSCISVFLSIFYRSNSLNCIQSKMHLLEILIAFDQS